MKGLAAGLKIEHTHRKQRLVNFIAEGTDFPTPLKIFQISVQIYICVALINMSEHRPEQNVKESRSVIPVSLL